MVNNLIRFELAISVKMNEKNNKFKRIELNPKTKRLKNKKPMISKIFLVYHQGIFLVFLISIYDHSLIFFTYKKFYRFLTIIIIFHY